MTFFPRSFVNSSLRYTTSFEDIWLPVDFRFGGSESSNSMGRPDTVAKISASDVKLPSSEVACLCNLLQIAVLVV